MAGQLDPAVAALLEEPIRRVVAGAAPLAFGPVEAFGVWLYMTDEHLGYAGPKVGYTSHINVYVHYKSGGRYQEVANLHVTRYIADGQQCLYFWDKPAGQPGNTVYDMCLNDWLPTTVQVEKRWYLVTFEEDRGLPAFLRWCLDRATSFSAYFPSAAALNGGLQQFRSLPQAAEADWYGMPGCRVLSARLDDRSHEAIRAWTLPAGERRPLWQYELSHAGEVFFRAADFSVHTLLATDAEVAQLRAMGFDTRLWAPIQMTV